MRLQTSWARLLGALLLAGLAAPVALADCDYVKTIYIRVGDAAPAIECKDDRGKAWKLSEHVGRHRYVVLYFYLGDFLKPSVQQAKAFRNDLGQFAAQGAEVVGVSGDGPKAHRLFKEKYGVNFPLLSDKDGAVAKAYGVSISGGGILRIKDSRGKEITLERGVTPSRWLWVIDKKGCVVYKDTNADPVKSSKQVLAFLVKQNKKR